MARTETVIVKLKGMAADVLNRLIETGFYTNKSEALRAGGSFVWVKNMVWLIWLNTMRSGLMRL
jgi:Arc/MetJ-type ribon-helix-helix transcriptional regulator